MKQNRTLMILAVTLIAVISLMVMSGCQDPIANEYTLTVTAENGGIVENVNGSYKENDKIILKATCDNGFNFDGWYINGSKISSELNYEYTMPAQNVEVIAKFNAIKYLLTVSSNVEACSVNITTGQYALGEKVDLIATAAEGYKFIGWYIGEQLLSNEAEYTYTIQEAQIEINILAKFVRAYSLTVNVDEGGKVNITSGMYQEGETIALECTAEVGYSFEGWYINEENVSGRKKYEFEMPGHDVVINAKLKNDFDGFTSVRTVEDLLNMKNDLTKNYILRNDIDMGGIEWTPLGYANGITPDENCYTGNFEGLNFTISNFKITAEQRRVGTGFFGFVNGSTIQNLKLRNITIDCTTVDFTGVGALIGYIYNGSVINCNVENSTIKVNIIKETETNMGGTGIAGGLIGRAHAQPDFLETSVIKDCYSKIDVKVTSIYDIFLGGFIGYDNFTTINCYATGNCTGIANRNKNANVAGFAGFIGGLTQKCYSTGNSDCTINRDIEDDDELISYPTYAAGFVGMNNGVGEFKGVIEDCYSTGNATSSHDLTTTAAGGFAAYPLFGKFVRCYSTGNADARSTYGDALAGGFVAANYYGCVYEDCYATGNVYAEGGLNNEEPRYMLDMTAQAGGFIGKADSSTISNCYATGSVESKTNYGWPVVGGFAGCIINNSKVTNCFSTGLIKATGIVYATSIAGFVGHLQGPQMVFNCIALCPSITVDVTNTYDAYEEGDVPSATVGYFHASNRGAPTTTNPNVKNINYYNGTAMSLKFNGTAFEPTLKIDPMPFDVFNSLTAEQITKDYYMNNMGWTEAHWNFDNVGVDNNMAPKLTWQK